MYYLPTSFLIFLVIFSIFQPLPCASRKHEHGLCAITLFRCGNITAGFPFWERNLHKPCGHPLLGLSCYENTTSLFISGHLYKVHHINQTSNTLRLSRQFGDSFCSSVVNSTTMPPQIFELTPEYKSITVFYHCHPIPFPRHLSSSTCPEIGVLSVSAENLQHHKTCNGSFKINVPKSFVPDEKELNMTDLVSTLIEGFEVKVKIDENACQECLSSHEFCGFNQSLPLEEAKCVLLVDQRSGLSTGAKAGIETASGLAVVLILIGGSLLCVISCLRKTSDDLFQQNLKALIPLKQYSYAQVKRITKSFAEVVGKGGFGTVYRGTLCDGRTVAVKILKDTMGNGEDFINEVASMSKTSHVNIVSLLGFCSEGSKRAIIYEYLKNGSLHQFISSKTSMKMDWMALYEIALGVGRGLEYLHHGCETRIVHFDIKPQNVLLDDNLCPKVSDFGLAKLCEKTASILSLLDTRGTVGYIAPEVFSRMYGRVSHKSDVYSYGMLVLEMIGARNKESGNQSSTSSTSSVYFPEWIYKDLEKGDNGRPHENGINSEEEEIAKKMTIVGLWCIQPSPTERPPMNRVVEMMEGNLNALEVPPRPVLQQIPTSLFQESSTLSEDSQFTEKHVSLNVT